MQKGLQLCQIVLRGVEPKIEVAWLQDDRHPVVECRNRFGSLGGQDGAGFDNLFPLLVFPMLPQAGKSHRLVICAEDVVGLLAVLEFLPFIKSGGRNQASATAEGGAK